MPDVLFRRAKEACVKRQVTFRELVSVALERELRGGKAPFALRDASAGYGAEPGTSVSADAVNDAIDSLREERPGP